MDGTSKKLPMSDKRIILLILAVGILIRVPFLGTFDLVSYDGTYYINHARYFFDRTFDPSGFPIGYPAAIALLLPLLRDGVRAAQAVSLLAGLGSIIVFYLLGRRFVGRSLAAAAALLFALTPLFVRLSMMTMSESLYMLFLLLGLLFYSRERCFFSGLLLGAAAVTRPEAAGIFAVLALLLVRRPRRLVTFIAGFAAVYSVNVAVQSFTSGRLVILSKANLFGTSAQYWKLRERWIDFGDSGRIIEKVSGEGAQRSLLADYIVRLPGELWMLARHLSPAVFLLGLLGMLKRRTFLLAALLPFLLFPIFTFRSEPRFIYPYIPVFLVYAAVCLDMVRGPRERQALLALVAASFAIFLFVNRGQVTAPVSDGYQWAKLYGKQFKERIERGSTIADRKPFFAFYAEGDYVEIPVAPYDETMESLATGGVEYLVLHPGTIHYLRPTLRPLMYDAAVIQGELRYSQIFFQPGVMALYRRALPSDPLIRQRVLSQTGGYLYGPTWAPDGAYLAYRKVDPDGSGGIYVVTWNSEYPHKILDGIMLEDPISWSPDSERIAFAASQGARADIFIALASGGIERITQSESDDRTPSWSADGREIYFRSDRSGSREVWSKNLETGELKQMTDAGEVELPAVSPDGDAIAWIHKGEGLYLQNMGSGLVSRVESPREVYMNPAWSPDGGLIAVTAKDWGLADIYLLDASGRRALLLTKTRNGESMPSWSPDGNSLAVLTVMDDRMEINILSNIKPYRERLMNPVQAWVFDPLE